MFIKNKIQVSWKNSSHPLNFTLVSCQLLEDKKDSLAYAFMCFFLTYLIMLVLNSYIDGALDPLLFILISRFKFCNLKVCDNL